MLQYNYFLPHEEIQKWNKNLPYSAEEFLLFGYDSKFDHEKEINFLSEYVNYIASNCDFFKNKDSASVDKMCRAIEKLNLLAVRMSAIISLTMNFNDRNAEIRISAIPFEISHRDMPLYIEATSLCDAMSVENQWLKFFCKLK